MSNRECTQWLQCTLVNAIGECVCSKSYSDSIKVPESQCQVTAHYNVVSDYNSHLLRIPTHTHNTREHSQKNMKAKTFLSPSFLSCSKNIFALFSIAFVPILFIKTYYNTTFSYRPILGVFIRRTYIEHVNMSSSALSWAIFTMFESHRKRNKLYEDIHKQQ